MKTTEIVLCLLDAWGGVKGRTLLQKRAFFVSVLTGLEEQLGFMPHYYGPYSPLVDNAIAELKSLGFVEELVNAYGQTSQGFEIKRYDYRLTEDGKEFAHVLESESKDTCERIRAARRKLIEAGDPSYFELSIAAKAYFILKAQHKPMRAGEIIKEAETFDWNVSSDSLGRAVDFLERVGLASTK